MSGDHGSSNNTHYLLGIIQPMTNTEQSRRNKLQFLKPHLSRMRMCTTTNVEDKQRESKGNNHPYKWCQKDKSSNLQYNIELNGIKTMSHNSSTSKTSNQRMRRRRRNPLPPCKQIPNNSCNNPRKNNRQGNILFHYCLGYSIGYSEPSDYTFSNKERNKIKKCRPYHRLERSKNLG